MLQLIPIVTPVQKQAEEFIMWVERAYRSNLQVQRKTPIDRFDLRVSRKGKLIPTRRFN